MGKEDAEMTLVYVGIFIMSLAFALVSFFIAKLLKRTSAIITTLGPTVSAVEMKLDKTVIELEGLIMATENTAADVETKLIATNGLFLAVKNIGDTSEIISSDLHLRTERYAEDQSLPGTKPFVRAIQVGEFGFGLFRSWKRGQNASS